MKDINSMGMSQEASVVSNKDARESMGMIDYFHVTCRDRDGNIKWKETIKNLVTDEGLTYVLQTCFTAEDAAETNWYVGLKATGAPATTDAAASLPNVGNWVEYETYDEATRPALTLNNTSGATTVSTVANAEAFTIDTPGADVFGVFVVAGGNTKGANTGATILYGVGDFTGGEKTGLEDGDTLNVTVTLSATSGA
jgi:hypothetical protein